MKNSPMKLINMDFKTLLGQTRSLEANPGGGALIIMIANLGLNLMLMMDKKDWKDLEGEANVSRETLLKLSDQLVEVAQADVENFGKLMDAFKADEVTEKDYQDAADPLMAMLCVNIEALNILGFYLEHGKLASITDGEISNDLLHQTVFTALPTIKHNLAHTTEHVDYDTYTSAADKLYLKNKEIIERRMK